MAAKRIVFVHYHLYKNAGTALDQVFEKALGPVVHLEAGDPDDSIENEALLQLLRERPDVSYISSHALKPPRPEIRDCYLIDVVFLRHPIDRFRSIYDFSRANSSRSGPTERAARRFGLAGFAAWMAHETPWNFFDPQTTTMGNQGDFFHPPTGSVLESAVLNTLQVRMLGTVELFDESLAAANRYLQGVRPGISLVAPDEPANVTISREKTLAERIRFVREVMGAKGFERLEQALELDFLLWKTATAEVSRRYRMSSGWVAATATDSEDPNPRAEASLAGSGSDDVSGRAPPAHESSNRQSPSG
jgi:hypothetical protein